MDATREALEFDVEDNASHFWTVIRPLTGYQFPSVLALLVLIRRDVEES